MDIFEDFHSESLLFAGFKSSLVSGSIATQCFFHGGTSIIIGAGIE